MGQYLLDHRFKALLIVLLLSLLPLLSSLAVLIVALLTLRQGWKVGLATLCMSLLPGLLLCAFGWLDVVSGVIAASTSIAVWIFAWQLQRGVSWRKLLQGAMIVGVVLVWCVHYGNPELGQWWQSYMGAYLSQAKQWGMNFSSEQIDIVIDRTARIATGVQLSFVLFSSLSLVVLGRYWESRLLKDSRWKQELLELRFSVPFTVFVIGLFAAGFILDSDVLTDVMPLVLLVEVLASLSLVHAFVRAHRIHWFWVVVFYIVALLLVAISVTVLLLLAMLDSFFNFRKKMQVRE